MDGLLLPVKKIALLLVKHGEEFTGCKEKARGSYLDCIPEDRIPSSGAAMRRQINRGDFTMRVSALGLMKPRDGMAEWSVFLTAKFGARSPSGARRSSMVYEVIAPMPSQLMALHEASQIALASGKKKLQPKRSIGNRTDTL